MMPPDVNIDALTKLAHLQLSAAEQADVAEELAGSLKLIDELQAAPVNELPVTNQVTDLENVYRADDVVAFEHHRTLVEQAPSRSADLFRVPGVFVDDEASHG